MRFIAVFLIGVALMLYGAQASDSRHPKDLPACKRFDQYQRQARCEIRRAAKHYRQSPELAVRVADCESDFRWWLDGTYEGMFQFLWSTWRTTPYAKRSPYSPKWNSMAAMWMWANGRSGEWGRCL